MKNVVLGCCLAICLVSASATGDSVVREPVDDFRRLLVEAIDSPTGDSHGVLIGELAQAVTQRFHATSPVLIDVTTLRRYKQAGCSRLNLRFSQQGVQLPGATGPRNKTFDLGLNYCRDGKPPASLA